MAIDVIVLVVLALVFLVEIKKNILLLPATSLFTAALASRIFVFNIQTILANNGFAQESYATIVVYLMIIIIVAGLVYALLGNFRLNFVKYQILSALIAGFFAATAIGIIICSALILTKGFSTLPTDSRFCILCHITSQSVFPNKVLISPENLEEAITLRSNLALGEESAVAENEVLNKINNARSSESQHPLSSDTRLKNLAGSYANSLIQSLRFSHLDVNNNSPADRAQKAGIYFAFIGENLAVASDVGSAHTALMNSSTHRANILSSRFSSVGVAAFDLNDGSVILVEEFLGQ